MIESRFIRLYKTLNTRELRAFRLWVHSPIHNQHQDTIKLFDFLNSRSKISAITVQKKRIFSHLYPNQKYNENKLNYLMNYALDLLKEFLGYNEVVLDDFCVKKKLIPSLKKRNMPHLAALELDKLATKTTNNKQQNALTSLHLYEIEQERFKLKGTQNRSIQTNLPTIFNHLTDFYCLSILKYACIASSHNHVTTQNYNIRFLETILEEAENHQHPIILLYYNLYQSLENAEGLSYFKQAETLFLKNHQLIDNQEQNEVLLLLINYCIKRLNTNAIDFIKKGFEWYRWGLEQNILIQENNLSRFAYLNIVGLGLKLEEFDWVKHFIPKYIDYVSLEFRENYQHYTTSKLFFKQKNYAKAQELLIQVDYDDIFLNLDAKTTLLEIYYEEKSWDALEALLISFSRYLQRKQVIAYHKQVYQNIILLTRKIMMLVPYDKAAKEILIEEIKTTNPLAERDWLLNQVHKL